MSKSWPVLLLDWLFDQCVYPLIAGLMTRAEAYKARRRADARETPETGGSHGARRQGQ